MPITITPITSADIPSAVQCIQRAFETDPYSNWVFNKTLPSTSGGFSKPRNFASLKAKCDWGMRSSYALFYVARDVPEDGESIEGEGSGTIVGLSMWTTPAMTSQRQSWSDWANDYRLWVEQGLNVLWYRGWGGLRRDRYWVWKREQARCQEELWNDEEGYYFVNIVVVAPEAQGKGIGRKLFEVVMERADREGRKCYLESSRWEPNVKIYERMGFEVCKKMRCVAEDGSGEGVDLFCMMRESKGLAK